MSEKPPFERELVHERYRILELLGSGASAQTYLCEDQASSGRRVALKLLRVEHLESWKYFELFEREAKVLASLDHHGIPKLFDFFELSAKGQERTSLGLVQEYIEGSSLAKRIEKGPRFAEAELIQLCLGILEILDYLHSSSPPVFHRDIKPSNIIVRPMGSPVLIDFGSVCDGWRPADEQGSTIVGTHGFMPPEQYLGQVSAASDLYALGATLLNLVSGRAPREFSFESGRIELPEELPMAAGMRRLLTALLEPAPRDRPKSARDARDLLLDPTPATSTLKPSAEVHALVPLKDALPALIQSDDDTPILVDLGAPGRDPEGPLLPVYRNLVPSHMRALQLSGGKPSKPAGALDVLLYILLTLSCIGLWPVIAAGVAHSRKKKHHQLFVDGVFTTGKLVATGGGNNGVSSLTYDFEVDGQQYRGQTGYPPQVGKYFGVGDRVGVLYDPENPRKNCLVFA